MAELVCAAFDTHYGKCSAFVRWGEDRWAHLVTLQKVAVCVGGKGLAGILLHMCCTGIFAGMPDLTLIRALKPVAASSGEAATTKAGKKKKRESTRQASYSKQRK